MNHNDVSPASDSPLLVCEGLVKCYGDKRAVNGLSLAVHKGEIVGLIGPDGAGKTTTMRLACGLLPLDGGSVRVCGLDVMRDPVAVKERIGYMPQRFSLYPDLSVEENIRFFADLFGVRKRERLEREERLMHFSRLAPFRKRRAAQLSGGMKQKLALCCTLIHTPEVLVLDEPTTGVDPLSRQEFWSILRELAAAGHALLLSTPYMDEATRCDWIILMNRGQVLARGTPTELGAAFPHTLLQVTGKDLSAAHVCLAQARPAGTSMHRVGNCLRVVFDTPAQENALRALLSSFDLRIERAAPTIEDVFVTRMQQGQDFTETAGGGMNE